MVDLARRRQFRRIVYGNHLSVRLVDMIDDRRRGDDEFQIVFPLEPFLHHIHVKQAKEAAPEAEAESKRRLRHKFESRVVQAELFERFFQLVVILRLHRIETAEDHGQRLAVARQRLFRAAFGRGDGVPHFTVVHVFDARRHITHGTAGQLLILLRERREIAHFGNSVYFARGHHADIHAGADGAVLHAHIGDGPLVRIEDAVEDQAAERFLRIIFRRGDALHDGFEHLVHVLPRLRADFNGVGHVEADDVLHFFFHALRVGGRQIDFIDDRDDLQIVVEGEIDVRQRLRLHALRGVDDEDRPFAGRQAPGYFIIEVHMPGGVDEIQRVGLSVFIRIVEPGGLLLDGDAPLPLEVHRVQDLRLHVPLLHGAGRFNEPVRQRGLAVVDVGDDGKIANQVCVHVRSPWQRTGGSVPSAKFVSKIL